MFLLKKTEIEKQKFNLFHEFLRDRGKCNIHFDQPLEIQLPNLKFKSWMDSKQELISNEYKKLHGHHEQKSNWIC